MLDVFSTASGLDETAQARGREQDVVEIQSDHEVEREIEIAQIGDTLREMLNWIPSDGK